MSFFFFSDIENLDDQQDNAFGSSENANVDGIEYEQFLVTSIHTATSEVNAIAVCKGQILVQEQSENEDLLNIIFRPIENQPFSFPKIRFFLYKGIRKDSLIASDDVSITSADSNDLTAAIWQAFNSLGLSGSPSKTLIGLTGSIDNLDDSYEIDQVFNQSFDGVEYLTVNAGNIIGKFDQNAFGFEIIFESANYSPPMGIARNDKTLIQSPALTSNPLQKDFFDHWHKKDAIVHFVDCCAFFSSFYFYGLNVISGTESNQWSGIDLYNNLINKFLNKNVIYIDIRNEFNFSLNYFKNYGNSPVDNTTLINLQKGESDDGSISEDYYGNGWPILTCDNSGFGNTDLSYQTISLQIPAGNGDNPSPLAYFSSGYMTGSDFPKEFSGSGKFFSVQVTNNYCEELNFSVPWNVDHVFCSYIHIKYVKQTSDENLPATTSTQIRRNDYLDGLFSPNFDFNIQTSVLSTKVFDEEIYIDLTYSHFFDSVFNIGINFDQVNVSLLANPYILNNTNSIMIRKVVEATGDFNTSFQTTQNIFFALSKDEGGAQFTVVPLIPETGEIQVLQYETSGPDYEQRFDIGDTRKIIGFNVTTAEWQSVVHLSTTTFLAGYPCYLMVNNKQYLQDQNQVMYMTINLNLTGFSIDGDNVQVQEIPTNINLLSYGDF